MGKKVRQWSKQEEEEEECLVYFSKICGIHVLILITHNIY
jgi:hypothetical protein